MEEACPRLQAIIPSPLYGNDVSGLDVNSLCSILRGDAPCSATLTSLHLPHFELSCEELGRVATALHAEGGVQLSSLTLCAGGGEEGVEGMAEVLGVLKGRAGRRLARLNIHLAGSSAVEKEGCMRLVKLLVEVMEAGGLPLIRSWPCWLVMRPEDHVYDIMASRRGGISSMRPRGDRLPVRITAGYEAGSTDTLRGAMLGGRGFCWDQARKDT